MQTDDTDTSAVQADQTTKTAERPAAGQDKPVEFSLAATLSPEPDAASTPDCQVVEFDDKTGQKKWSEAVFVQDFTDSVLDTLPGELQ